VATYISKGVTTLPHNYHAGRLRHNATKIRACNLHTPQNFTGTTALDSRQLPPQNRGSVELNHAATTHALFCNCPSLPIVVSTLKRSCCNSDYSYTLQQESNRWSTALGTAYEALYYMQRLWWKTREKHQHFHSLWILGEISDMLAARLWRHPGNILFRHVSVIKHFVFLCIMPQ